MQVVEIAASDEISISKISFHCEYLEELRLEARTRAVAAARQKADVLAAVADRKVKEVIHLEDVNPERLDDDGHQIDTHVVGLSDDALYTSPFSPRSITVAAGVMAAFSFEP